MRRTKRCMRATVASCFETRCRRASLARHDVFARPGNTGFFREFRKRGNLGTPLTSLCVGARVLRNRWKRKMNGRLKRDGNGQTRAAQRRRYPAFSGLLEIAACEPTSPRSTVTSPHRSSIPSHLLQIGSSNETSSARSCRCRPFQSTVQLPFPKNAASVMGISSPARPSHANVRHVAS